MYSALLVRSIPFQIFLDYKLTDNMYSKVLRMARVLGCCILSRLRLLAMYHCRYSFELVMNGDINMHGCRVPSPFVR